MIYMETERLLLRDWKEDDLKEFKKMNADEEVMRYFPKVMSAEESEEMYYRIKDEIKTYGYGLYAVEVKQTGKFIGFIGLHEAKFDEDFTPCVEIGWRLAKEAWGKGYATEGGRACLGYATQTLGIEEIYSFTATVNTPSENVMKKIGLRYIKNFNHPKLDEGHILCEHVLYKNESLR